MTIGAARPRVRHLRARTADRADHPQPARQGQHQGRNAGAGSRRLPSRGRPRQRDQGRDPQGQRQGLLRRARRPLGSRREPLPGLRRHLRGPVQGHRRPVPLADAVPVGVSEADHLADPRLLHGRRHLPGSAHRLLRRIGGRVLPDAARAEPRRARRAHHDRAVAADELASHHGLVAVGANAFRAGGARVGPAEQGGAA